MGIYRTLRTLHQSQVCGHDIFSLHLFFHISFKEYFLNSQYVKSQEYDREENWQLPAP